jgi:hypothetical protein
VMVNLRSPSGARHQQEKNSFLPFSTFKYCIQKLQFVSLHWSISHLSVSVSVLICFFFGHIYCLSINCIQLDLNLLDPLFPSSHPHLSLFLSRCQSQSLTHSLFSIHSQYGIVSITNHSLTQSIIHSDINAFLSFTH